MGTNRAFTSGSISLIFEFCNTLHYFLLKKEKKLFEVFDFSEIQGLMGKGVDKECGIITVTLPIHTIFGTKLKLVVLPVPNLTMATTGYT